MKRMTALSALSLAGFAAFAGNVSHLEVECYLDNGATPAARVVPGGDSVEIPVAADWFPQGGDCRLYVDGVLAATSYGGIATGSLSGVGESWRTYRLTLECGGQETEKYVTFLPSSGFACMLHAVETSEDLLDARPAGTIRLLKNGAAMDISWSGMWSDSATGANVSLYSGQTASGDPVATLVVYEGRDEGSCSLSDAGVPLAAGDYTLTHFDGVETLTAYLRIVGAGFKLLFR